MNRIRTILAMSAAASAVALAAAGPASARLVVVYCL